MGIFDRFLKKDTKKEDMLRCKVCGNTQRRGDWEEAMDAQAKAMGARGFVNIGAEPQCLKCGSRELFDPSQTVLKTEAHETASLIKARPIDEDEPKFVTDAVIEIVNLMQSYFNSGVSLEKEIDERLVTIGKSLYEKGGHKVMLQVFKKTRNLAHRRFGYTGTNRYLEMTWGGIGEWRG